MAAVDYALSSPAVFDATVPCMLGIDEAGRGPVLGPMVYASAYCAVEDLPKLKKVGFIDSKQTKESEREALLLDIISGAKLPMGYDITVISPEELSYKMLDLTRTNLNEISHNAAIDLIKTALAKGVNITEVYIDTVGNPQRYQMKLEKIFPKLDITVSKKADSLFPIVSAASICAKVTRDRVLASWQFKEDRPNLTTEFGSGYPSDPKTKAWLRSSVDKVFGYPSVVRFSWKPSVVILDKSAVPVKWGEEEAESQQDSKQKKIKFASRYRFFSDNDMDVVYDF